MILSDQEICCLINDGKITGPGGDMEPNTISELKGLVQPASLDFPIEATMKPTYLPPLGFLLVSSKHIFHMPVHLSGQIATKSTWARRGLMVHPSAGFVDPNFSGQLTLELFNCSSQGIDIFPGAVLAQMVFFLMSKAPLRPYNGKYQGQRGPTGAK